MILLPLGVSVGVPAPLFAANTVFFVLIVVGIPLALFVASIFFLTYGAVDEGGTREELYDHATKLGIKKRSTMRKDELAKAIAEERTLWRFRPKDLGAIGSSLLTGSLVALAIFGLQFYLDREDESRTKEEQFRLTLAISKDLEGLDPPLPLTGLNLPDKNLDQAQLAGEDLTDTNLAGSSLRNANLEGASLEGANLYRADLTGALLTGADFDDATLASANLRDASIYGPSGVELGLDGTDVDAKSCWPADFLTSQQEGNLRNQLDPQPIVKTGRTVKDPSIGYACELTFDNVLQHLEQPVPPRTLDALAVPYDVTAEKFLAMVSGRAGDLPTDERPLELRDRPCAGSRRVLSRNRGWQDATGLLTIESPTQSLRKGRAMLIGQEASEPVQNGRDVLVEPGERLASPLAAGSTVELFVAASRIGVAPDYATQAQVSAC
jgi:hypothetical protein